MSKADSNDSRRVNITGQRRQSSMEGQEFEFQPSTSRGQSSYLSSSSDDSDAGTSQVHTQLSSYPNEEDGDSDETSSPELSRVVMDCAFYILIADQKKHMIKKTDIIKHVIKENKKNYDVIMRKVKNYLFAVMGFTLHELIETHKGHYILVNHVPKSFAQSSDAEHAKTGFLVVILSIIFMNGNSISEEDLWKAAENLGLRPEVKHPLLGDVKKYIQELVKQMYLNQKKEAGDPPTYSFSWGIRAEMEVSKKTILKFVCNIYGDGMKPEQWPTQYAQSITSEDHVP